jgi:hypothetical protein
MAVQVHSAETHLTPGTLLKHRRHQTKVTHMHHQSGLFKWIVLFTGARHSPE